MTRTQTPRTRSLALCAAAAATALLTAACGGSSAPSSSSPVLGLNGTPTPTTKTGGASIASAPASTKASAGAPGSAASPKSGAAGTTKSGASTSKGAPAAVGKPSTMATAAGTYTYDANGTFTAGTPRAVKSTSSLKVDKPVGNKQHSVLGGDQGSTDQTVQHNETGTYLVQLKLDNPAFSKEFAPDKPVLLAPRPLKVGSSWSWTMTSTDGKTTAAFNATVSKTETLTIGGKKTPTSVIESTLKLSGDVDYTAKTTTNYDEAHLLQVKDHTRGSGSYSGFPFSTDITSVLRSTTPS